MAAFAIEVTRTATRNLNAIQVYVRRRIMDAIEEQLTSQPEVKTRNRKRIDDAAPPFEHVPPLWELRVGEYRVYLARVDGEVYAAQYLVRADTGV